jgi:hypothetical protein
MRQAALIRVNQALRIDIHILYLQYHLRTYILIFCTLYSIIQIDSHIYPLKKNLHLVHFNGWAHIVLDRSHNI